MFEFLIYRPLGWIINVIYNLVSNYGWSIVIFTIIVKLILLPLNIKSQKAMRKQQKVQPIIMELQKKYANDQQKLQQEMMKIYKENNISLMGGCWPLLIQFPILIGLYKVIQSPIKYIKGADINDSAVTGTITQIVEKMKEINPGALGIFADKSPADIFKNAQMQLSNWSAETGIGDWGIDFNFLGLDLSKNPSASLSPIMSGDFSKLSVVLLILIPIIAMATTWFSSWHAQKMNKKISNTDDSAAQMTKSMNLIMPLMTGFFAFSLPAGLGVYWIAGNIFQIAQQYFVNLYFEKEEDDFIVKIPENNRKKRKKRK